MKVRRNSTNNVLGIKTSYVKFRIIFSLNVNTMTKMIYLNERVSKIYDMLMLRS